MNLNIKLVSSLFLLSLSLQLVHSHPAPHDLQCTTEAHRPHYHFSPVRNWINDPNGMIYHDGVYHLYFQYNPSSSTHGNLHWGHAVSRDLATWEEVDIALFPDELGLIFSGSSVLDSRNTSGLKPINSEEDPIIAIYTSHLSVDNGQVEAQCIAVSLDSGMTFTTYENNPVLTDPTKPDFRDPKVYFYGDSWVMSLAVQDRVEFFSSPNLIDWKYESEFGRDPIEGAHGGVWECPDLRPFDVEVGGGERVTVWVLIVSINPGGPNIGSAAHYFIGNFSRNSMNNRLEFHTFPWNESQWLDWGPDDYAEVTFDNDPQGRAIYMGWMNNWIYANQLPTTTWRGQMTIPREMSVKVLNKETSQYRVVSTPIKELEALRNPFEHLEVSEEFQVPPQTVIELTAQASFDSPRMELEITVNITDNPLFSICAYNPEGEESCFGWDGNKWYLDRTKSGNVNFNENFARTLLSHATREVNDQVINIRMFLDVSSLEVFADDGLTSMTALHYPSKPFNKFYINHWSSSSSSALLTVKKFSIWGLLCWYPEAN